MPESAAPTGEYVRATRASNCEVCGAELVATGRAGRPPERFCTAKCRSAFWGKREHRRPPSTTVTVERDDVAVLVDAWHKSTGLRRKAGVDPAAIDLAAKRLTAALEEPTS